MKKPFILIFAAFILWGCSGNQGSPEPPNIMIISIDTLRADHLHCYGYPHETSPNIDQFAKENVLFEFAYTPIPKTSAAFCSMMTGLHPFIHKCRPNRGTVQEHLTTLAEALKKKGYRTSAVVDNANLAKSYQFNQGFDKYIEVWNETETKAESTPFITRSIIDFLKKPRKKPFFFWANYIEPHTPYIPPQEHIQPRPPGRDIRTVKPGMIAGNIVVIRSSKRYEEGYHTSLYDGAIHYIDSEIGRILDVFRASSFSKNTILIITADHGEDLGEHNFFFNHGPLTFNAASRVPLIIHWPGKQSRRVRRPVSIMDITPTLMETIGISAPAYPLQGKNLFTNRAQRNLILFGMLGTQGVVSRHYHYVQVQKKLQKQLGLEPAYIFHILKDPYERINRIGEFRNLADTLSKRYKAYYGRHGYLKKNKKSKEPKLTEKEKKSLKTLGYL